MRCSTPGNLDVEGAFEKEERFILLMVNMSAGPYAWLDDVLKDGVRTVCLGTRKKDPQSDSAGERQGLCLAIARVNGVHL